MENYFSTFLCVSVSMYMCCVYTVCIHGVFVYSGGHEVSYCIIRCLNPLRVSLSDWELGWQPTAPVTLPLPSSLALSEVPGAHGHVQSFTCALEI